jgi:AcrR family transcriptional regulator
LQNLREHILAAAYPLFAERGVEDVSTADIQEAAHVSAEELNAEFPSTRAIAAACLVQHDRERTIVLARKAVQERAGTPEGRLLALFDVLEEGFQSDEDEGRTFMEVLIDLARDNRAGRADVAHLANVRAAIAGLAREAELPDPDGFALTFHVLVKGSILSAMEGDTLAGVRGRAMGRELIDRCRRDRLTAESAVRPATTWFGDSTFDFEDLVPTGGSSSSAVLDWYDDIEFGPEQTED